MWGNTIPLPPELVEETLRHCGPRELFAFAQTSRESYIASVRVLAARGQIPLSLPQVVTSGMIKLLKESKAYDLIDTVSIDVTKDVMRSLEGCYQSAYYTPLAEFISSRPEEMKLGLRLCTHGEGACSLPGLVLMFRRALETANDRFSSFALRITIDDAEQTDAITAAEDMQDAVLALRKQRASQNDRQRKPLESLELQIGAVDGRNITQCFLELGVDMTGNDDERLLQHLKVVVDWKNTSDDSLRFRWERLDFSLLGTSHLKTLYLEEKKCGQSSDYVDQFTVLFPELEELHIDTGLPQSTAHYGSFRRFEKLRKLSIPFPYQDSRFTFPGVDQDANAPAMTPRCCMRSEFWERVQRLVAWQLQPGFKELVFHYLWNDARMTNFTRISVWRSGNRKNRTRGGDGEGEELQEQEEAEQEEDNPEQEDLVPLTTENIPADEVSFEVLPSEAIPSHIRREFLEYLAPFIDDTPFRISMKDLGDRPTHPSDLTAIRSLLLGKNKETGAYRLREGRWAGAPYFLAPWLREMIGSDAFNDGEKLADGKDRNQRGVKCEVCGL
ncbi:hypothetical protein TWF696_003218 [Orbilia brochopaga]|uniref:F-box domain-containing protein n=1 Tax=Orbilia brochopaga TaxID=3140254 RepID=A0AAV9TZE6_9PEZI